MFEKLRQLATLSVALFQSISMPRKEKKSRGLMEKRVDVDRGPDVLIADDGRTDRPIPRLIESSRRRPRRAEMFNHNKNWEIEFIGN